MIIYPTFYQLLVSELHLEHGYRYYVTVEAVNAVGKKTSAFSQPLLIDDTPPVPGVAVELQSNTLPNAFSNEETYSDDALEDGK